MSQEEKYKLALFAVIRNSTVMPQGVKLGKTMHEINTMAVVVMANIMESCDFERLKESYESVQNWDLRHIRAKLYIRELWIPIRFIRLLKISMHVLRKIKISSRLVVLLS